MSERDQNSDEAEASKSTRAELSINTKGYSLRRLNEINELARQLNIPHSIVIKRGSSKKFLVFQFKVEELKAIKELL